jgi:putative colanic acid biosynthesis glycosyltransferase WcaI
LEETVDVEDAHLKLLILGSNYAPEAVGIGKYTSEMAEWCAARGDSVRVVTAPPHYPEWQVPDGYSWWKYSRESRNGVDVLRCPAWVPSKPSGLTRIIHQLTFAGASAPALIGQRSWRPDVVLAVAPPTLAAPFVSLVAGRSTPTWLHVQDLEIDAAFELGMLSSSRLRRLVNGVERSILAGFDVVSAPAERMVERIQGKGVLPQRCCVFPNWVDTGAILPEKGDSAFRSELGIPRDQLVALYSGSMGEKHGLEILVEAARELPEITFCLCGDGPGLRRLREMSAGTSSIRWLPLQPIERLNELLNLADIHLLPQRPGAADLVMPSKLTGMFASGRPVVATASGGTSIEKAVRGKGRVVEPGDTRAFVNAIRDLANDPAARTAMGAEGRRFATGHCDRDVVLQSFRASLQELVAQ